MDPDWLSERLEEGRSIESIAQEVGKDGSTVAYWVHKHGLTSRHATRHASREPITREALEALISEGASTRDIAAALDRSQTTIRHWLRKHGLETKRASRRPPAGLTAEGFCPTHGPAEFRLRSDGRWRCQPCRTGYVSDRRRRVKVMLVEEAGGACVICGYDRTPAALQFHHVDPAAKSFGIGNGACASIASVRTEAAKCALLCANCHVEVEIGFATLPDAPEPPPG